MKDRQTQASHGFSLVELLIVVAVIALLLSMMIPMMYRARQAGYSATCKSNFRTMGMATNQQSMDHGGYPPGCYQIARGSEPWQAPWLGVEVLKLGKKSWAGWMPESTARYIRT